MLFELLAAIAMGFGAAGVALLLRRLSGGRLPAVVVPVAAGAAMLGFAIWSEYSWFDRSAGALPEGIVVTNTARESAVWRPWSYLWPQVTRFTAVNAAGARTNPKLPGQVLTDVYLVARGAPAIRLPQIVDCEGERRAELMGEVTLDDDGSPVDADWRALPSDDPLYQALCEDGAPRNQG